MSNIRFIVYSTKEYDLYNFMSGGHYMKGKYEVSDEFYLIATSDDFYLTYEDY